MFRKLFDQLNLLTAAEATVISFLLASLIGGVALYATEHGRAVNEPMPAMRSVQVTPLDDRGRPLLDEAYRENHTYLYTQTRQGITFVDALFTAVSALCVTGLTSTDFSQFTLAGQLVVMLLIQMGGLGIILFTSIFALVITRGLSEHTAFKKIMKDILDTRDHDDVRNMIRHVLQYTLVIELGGFLIMGVRLASADAALTDGVNPWWWALFHSISAFNNAGFGLLNTNLANFLHDPVINLVIAAQIILGGLGYPVLIFLHYWVRGRFRRRPDAVQRALHHDVDGVVASNVQVRVALVGTMFLIIFGWVVTGLVEWDNTGLGPLSAGDKVLMSFFQSVSTRTAGFNTVDIGTLHLTTLFCYILLMFIGANPAGTAGGIKIPTVAVLYGYIKDWFRKPGEAVVLLNKRVSKFAVSHAVRLFFFSVIFIAAITTAITFVEKNYLITPDPTFNSLKVVFEIVSAFGTVGLSMGFKGGVTSFSAILTPFSKLLIILTMLFGRLGPLTILASLPWKRRYTDHPLSEDYPGAEKIQIG